MAKQLLLYPDQAPDHFRWCWLDADHQPMMDSASQGDLELLASILADGHQRVWLLVPGAKVNTRELEYTEAEKKHLRRLLPFQMEESVIGDIDQFHFALGPARDGRVPVAYVEKPWLKTLFERLEPLNIEVFCCSSVPLLLPLPLDDSHPEAIPTHECPRWTLQLQGGELLVRYAPNLGYSVEQSRGRLSLQLLLTAQERIDNQPKLTLRAEGQAGLDALEALLPKELADRVDSREQVTFWDLDFSQSGIDLCQGDFSQRLPIERWWRDWRGVAAAAAASLLVYVGVLFFEVQTLQQENLAVRQETEQAFRQVIDGRMTNAEVQLNQAIEQVQPAGAGRRVTPFLEDLLPALDEADKTTIRSIAYAGQTGEINLSVQADGFSSIDALRQHINERGLEAELLNSNVQGDVYSARMKIRQPLYE